MPELYISKKNKNQKHKRLIFHERYLIRTRQNKVQFSRQILPLTEQHTNGQTDVKQQISVEQHISRTTDISSSTTDMSRTYLDVTCAESGSICFECNDMPLTVDLTFKIY